MYLNQNNNKITAYKYYDENSKIYKNGRSAYALRRFDRRVFMR